MTGFVIKEIHAVVCVGEDGDEGVPAIKLGEGLVLPLIAADPDRLEDITKWGRELAQQFGQDLKIVKFSVREEIGEIKADGCSSEA